MQVARPVMIGTAATLGGATLGGSVLAAGRGDGTSTGEALAAGGAALLGGAAIAGALALRGRGGNVDAMAVHDIQLGADLLRAHHVAAADVAPGAGVELGGRWVHATGRAAREDIISNGVRIDGVSGDGAYGQGFYLSRTPIRAYGSNVVPIAVTASNPLRVRERTFLDQANFGRQVAPLVDAYRAAGPDQAAMVDSAELIRASLRHAGHDAIVIERTGMFAGEPWLVALDPNVAKVVVRSPAGTGSS